MKTRSQWLGFWVVSLTLMMCITRSSAAMRSMNEVHVVRRADAHETAAHPPSRVAKDSVGEPVKKVAEDPHPKAPAAAGSTTSTSAASAAAPATSACGNGIVDKGEECDCGTDANCAKDPCCDRKTCKLTPGSMCSNSQSCCDKCRLRPSTFVCRGATPTCSLVQTCTGLNPTCPSARNTCHENESRMPATPLTGVPVQNEEEVAKDQAPENAALERDPQCRAQSTATETFSGACPEASGLCHMYCLRGVSPSGSGNSSSTEPRSSLAGVFVLCCAGILGYRRWQHKRTDGYYYGGRRKKEKERKVDIFPMVQTSNGKSRPRSNVRIGLDPMEPREYYDHLSFRHQDAMPSGSRPPKYAPDALKSDRELREELEADGELGWIVSGGGERRGSHGIIQQHHHQQAISPPRPSLHASPLPLPSHVPLIPTRPGPTDPLQGPSTSRTPPRSSGSSSTSNSNTKSSNGSGGSSGSGSGGSNVAGPSPASFKGKEAVYTPPPLPPADVRSGGSTAKRQSVSPYADEAMFVLPPASPPVQVVISTGRKNSHPNIPPAPTALLPPAPPTITAPPTLAGLHIPRPGLHDDGDNDDDDDEPSLLQLNSSSLMVDESSRRQDRTSVSSFFSALQLEPDPSSSTPLTPTSPTFSGGGGGINAVPLSPATALAIHLVTGPNGSSSSVPKHHPMSSTSSLSSQSTVSMDEHSDSTISISEPVAISLTAASPSPSFSSSNTGSTSYSSSSSYFSSGAHGATAKASPPPKVVQGFTKPYQTTEYVIPTPVARKKAPSVTPPKVTPYPASPAPTMPPPPPPTSSSSPSVSGSSAAVATRTPRQPYQKSSSMRRHPHEQPQPATAKELANDLGFELVDP
ncbi:hypothetical protein DFQ27_008451 [Actinomortierella ambigua]|uniref:Disintegrin and metalloproteinase domain-containing protein B n=1 Tax=Actinomortierella ambigua TaxID=1343610 RepID=A0A9P6UBK0_9FUNG|nr:hypothetical protein DFQ27_008451 [Actinomortierella ambigua]